ncbi:MAG: hypothetical protein KDE27_09865 [Planctomycetes bacterium]|nr:hypothetical protein [Planctomycetota bacterium]
MDHRTLAAAALAALSFGLPALLATAGLPSQSVWLAERNNYASLDSPAGSGQYRMTHDAARGRLVMVAADGGLYEFRGADLARGPGRGSFNTVLWFPPQQRTLLLGIYSEAWDGVELQPLVGAPALAIAAYDSNRGVLVATDADHTFEYDGTSWQQIATATPGIIGHGRSMAFDPIRNKMLLYGRDFRTLTYGSWEYSGGVWLQHSAAHPLLAAPTLVFDPTRGRVAAFQNSFALEFDGSSWVPRPGPLDNFGYAVVFDPDRGRLVAIGSFRDELREFDGSSWIVAVERPFLAGPGFGDRIGTFDEARGRFVRVQFPASGQPATQTAEWDGARWHLPLPATVPPTRSDTALTYDPIAERVLMFGGLNPGTGWRNDFWSWNGTDWQQLPSGPPARARAGFAFDRGRGRAVLVGGFGPNAYTPLHDHWEWDGTSWHQIATTSPDSLDPRSLVYDELRDVLVLGLGSQHWEYAGGVWTQRGALPQGTPELTYDNVAQRVVMKGLLAMWEWDGNQWLARQATPTNFASNGIVFDRRRGVVLADATDVMTFTDRVARAERFGQGCGPTNRVPRLGTFGEPVLGEPAFGLDVVGTAPNSLCITGLSFGGVTPTGSGCELLLAPGIAALVGITNGSGFAHFPQPLPQWESFRGVELFAQAFALDALAPNGYALSQGLKLVLGD